MKIIDRKTFLEMPRGTLFSEFQPDINVFGHLRIKGKTEENDFLEQQIVDSIRCHDNEELFCLLSDAESKGVSIPMDFYCQTRNGMVDNDRQMFAVWDRKDVEQLIWRLLRTIIEGV